MKLFILNKVLFDKLPLLAIFIMMVKYIKLFQLSL